MKCPRCQADVEGRFCGFCGSALDERECPECSASVPAGHRFCSSCGSAVEDGNRSEGQRAGAGGGVPAGPARQGPIAPGQEGIPSDPVVAPPRKPDRRSWWIAGLAVAGAVAFLAMPYVWTGWADQGNAERMPMGGPTAAPAPPPGGTGVDLSSMTPREAADRLFNRVMTALGEGDRAEVESFLPMAIDAYRLVPELDADGHFHLSLLQQAAGDYEAGLATAERVLDTQPDHLLALYAAGEAARELGDRPRAEAHFSHLLQVFDDEAARDLPEYREHAGFLPTMRETAERFLAGAGP
jgi:hypothetical protein